MKKFLHSHPNIVIGTLATVLVIVLVSFYSWAIDDVFDQMGRALASPSAQNAVGFDLPGASKLDLRGLMGGVAPAPVSVAATTATVVTSTPAASSSTLTVPTP
jgi:hypothetical protein